MMSGTQYLENIILFLGRLRTRGFVISSAEAGDVAELLASIDLTDRDAVRLSLRALLSGSNRECRFFDDEFNAFFVSERTLTDDAARREEDDNARLQRINEAREELGVYDLPEETYAAYSEAEERRKQWLKSMMENITDSDRYMPLAEDYVKRIATGWLAEGARGLRKKEREEEEDLLFKDLSLISGEEAPRALQLIETLVRRVNGAAERRYKRAGRDGMPDIRATIHRSLRTGGVPLHPQYKKRPRTARRVVVLCDVSESMYRFSGFALRFITALSGASGKTNAYIFSEGIEEISLSVDFEDAVKDSDLWRLGTDVGKAIDAILEADVVNSNTLLIILSDARTVNVTHAEAALRTVVRIARAVLWMNPDGEQAKSAEQLARVCTMLECSTLDALSRACARVSAL